MKADLKKVYWSSEVPTHCQTCDVLLNDIFYDARTATGPWAIMCSSCFWIGPGLGRLGTGFGQKYKLQSDGKWLKVDG